MKHVILFAALFSLTLPAFAQEMPPKPVFPLGLWYEGGVGNTRDNVLPADPAKAAEIYEKNFADIAAHNINVVVIPNSPPEHHKLILDTAQKHGLYVILELGLDGAAQVLRRFGDAAAPVVWKRHDLVRRREAFDELLVAARDERACGDRVGR